MVVAEVTQHHRLYWAIIVERRENITIILECTGWAEKRSGETPPSGRSLPDRAESFFGPVVCPAPPKNEKLLSGQRFARQTFFHHVHVKRQTRERLPQ
ncbi:hypothetical protein L596_015941 [Steinernema carpocapsae]|uniref:Uncharacterized protein n=1 Tax=Steinernema carpocapsae TaxID=34508 RepID=A0A4U5NGM5_STECR|nr:hypothetical protein L596_015941 [Steinernema carpocapsae]